MIFIMDFVKAVEKAPMKSSLLHMLAEVYCQLGLKDRAAIYAERAFLLQVRVLVRVRFDYLPPPTYDHTPDDIPK